MRDNTRIKERYELSLDGTQVASVVVGSLVVLGAVFALGLNVGKQLGQRAAPPPARAENPLAVLDRPAPPAPEPREKEPKLSFHDALTKGPAESAAVAEPRPAPRPDPAAAATGTALNALPAAPSPQPSPPPGERETGSRANRAGEGAPPATPTRSPTPTKPAKPAAAPKKSPMAAAVAKASALPADATGAFAVQVGATQSEAEAQRLLKRHSGEGARIAVADVPGKGRWYRVKVGAFATRAEAEKRLAALKARGVQGFVTDGR